MNPFLARLIGMFAARKPIVKPITMTEPTVKKAPLNTMQYYQTVNPKKYIILHHTAGGSAMSSINHWASNAEHIATPYVIDRDGTIFETYDPKFWAYHLGVKGYSAIEKASIGIEIANYGALTPKDGKFYTYTNKEIPAEKVVKLAAPFRGFQYWESYTPEQIAALKQLLPYLLEKFKIKMQPDRNEFWNYRNPATLPPGVWSHTTVRQDKIDIFPQPEIIEVVNNL